MSATDNRLKAASPYILAALTLLVLFARRPDQFLHPYIWVEDGREILPEFMNSGFWGLFKAVSGYQILATKIISFTAFKLSILKTPEIELILVAGFTCFVVMATAFSPTHLRWPFACACAILIVPTDAEVFAVSSYAFWWAGILLFLALLWDTDRGHAWVRWVYIVLGGLSSPIIAPVAAVLGLRAALERTTASIAAAALAIATAGVQIYTYSVVEKSHVSWPTALLPSVLMWSERFVGSFFYANADLTLDITLTVLMGIVAWTVRARLDRHFYLLVVLFIFSCATISLRLDPLAKLDPFLQGPRYFFYPFILLSWVVIWLASFSPVPVQIGFAAVFAGSLSHAGGQLSRRHDPINWRKQVRICEQSDSYQLPIHYTGDPKFMWNVTMTGEQCKYMLTQTFFDRP